MKNLKPYGKILPLRLNRWHLNAWVLGVRDGRNQPYALSTSTNVEHLMGEHDDWTVEDSLDRGINLGQWLRSPLNHEKQEA